MLATKIITGTKLFPAFPSIQGLVSKLFGCGFSKAESFCTGHIRQLIPLDVDGQFEDLLTGVLDKREWLYNVVLCYLAEVDDLSALNLLKQILKAGEDSDHLKELALASSGWSCRTVAWCRAL